MAKAITSVLTAVRISCLTDNKMAPSTQTPQFLQYFLSLAWSNLEEI